MKKLILAAMIASSVAAANAADINLPVVPSPLPLRCTAKSVSVDLLGFDRNNNVQGSITENAICIGYYTHGATYRYPITQVTDVTWDLNGGYVDSLVAALTVPAANPSLAADTLGNSVAVSGSTVTLSLNNAPVTIIPVASVVPDFTGDTTRQATAISSKLSLVPNVTFNYTYDAPVNTVFNQSPAPGTVLHFGDTVYLWVRR